MPPAEDLTLPSTQEPQNVILLGNKVYYRCKEGKDGEIILDWGGSSIQYKRQKSRKGYREKESGHLKVEAEIGVMCSQTKEYRGLLATARSYQKSVGYFLLKLQKEPILTPP